MFGYVRVAREELRVREYEYYRASYCGLCRAMGKCTGQCSRLTLSYDFAFLANLRILLSGTRVAFRRRRCIVHPFRARVMMEPNDPLRYCADASAIMAYEKCRDDLADERGAGRIKAFFRRLFLSGGYRRAKRRHPDLAARVREILAALSEKERARLASVDQPAALFGDLLSAVMAEGLEGPAAQLAATVGYQVGRFIYIVDAVDDLNEDIRKKRYNPLALLYGGQPSHEEKEGIEAALIAALREIEGALDLVNTEENPTVGEILRNILYLGMPLTVRRALYGTENEKEKMDDKPL